MKKFIVICGILLGLCTTAQAEEDNYSINIDDVYKAGNFNNKEEVKKLMDDFAQSNTPDDPQKNTASNFLNTFYLHPEYTPIMEATCQKSMPWIKGAFGLWEEPYFRADLCLTWETNKKLNKEQIELLAHLKLTWENVIGDLHQKNDVGASYGRKMEYSLQQAVRIYNLVLHQDWPECLFETGKSSDYLPYDNKPCNVESPILSKCRQTDNVIACMQEKLTIAIQTLVDVDYKDIAPKDMDNLLYLTNQFIATIEPNKDKQHYEIVRLYNFYWLSIHDAYDVISLFAKTSVE